MEKLIKFKECRDCPHVLVMIDGRGFCEEQHYKLIALDTIDEDCPLEDAPVGEEASKQDNIWVCPDCGKRLPKREGKELVPCGKKIPRVWHKH